MIDIKKFEREVIDEVKPDLIIRYLIMNEIKLIPKEVTWFIIEKLYNVRDDVIILYQDINKIYWCQLFFVKIQSNIDKKEVNFPGVSPQVIADIEYVVDQSLKTMYNPVAANVPKPINNLDMTIPINMSEPLSLLIEAKLMAVVTKDDMGKMVNNMMKQMIVGVLKSKEKYLACLNLPPKATNMINMVVNSLN